MNIMKNMIINLTLKVLLYAVTYIWYASLANLSVDMLTVNKNF